MAGDWRSVVSDGAERRQGESGLRTGFLERGGLYVGVRVQREEPLQLVRLMAKRIKRRKNPKRHMPPALKRYWAARNKRLRNPKRKRRKNPVQTQHVLFAQKSGGHVLKYVGGVKFSRSGHAVRFASRPAALEVGRELKRRFPVLKSYRVWAT